MNMFRSLSGFISSSVETISNVQQTITGSPPPSSVAPKTKVVERGVPLPRSASAVPRLRLSPSPPPLPPQVTPSSRAIGRPSLDLTDAPTTGSMETAVVPGSPTSSGATSSPDSEPPLLPSDDEEYSDLEDNHRQPEVVEYDDDIVDVDAVVGVGAVATVAADADQDDDEVAYSSDENVDFDDDDDSSESEYGRRSPSPTSPMLDASSVLPDVLPPFSPDDDVKSTEPTLSRTSSTGLLASHQMIVQPPPSAVSVVSQPPRACSAAGSAGGNERTSRRSSMTSTAGEPPEFDLSHLSEEERAVIALVMERAKMMEDEVMASAVTLQVSPSPMKQQQVDSLATSTAASSSESAEELGELSGIGTETQPLAANVVQFHDELPGSNTPPSSQRAHHDVNDHGQAPPEIDYIDVDHQSRRSEDDVTAISERDDDKGVVAVEALRCSRCISEQLQVEDGCCDKCMKLVDCTPTTEHDADSSSSPPSVATTKDERPPRQTSVEAHPTSTTKAMPSRDVVTTTDPPSTSIRRPVLEDGLSPAVSPSELDGSSDNDPDDATEDGYHGGVFQKIYSRPRNLHIGRHASVPSAATASASQSIAARGETSWKRRSSTGSPGGSSTGSDSSEHATPTSSSSSTSISFSGVQLRHHPTHSHQADVVERRRSVPPALGDRSSLGHQHDGVGSGHSMAGTLAGGHSGADRNQSPSRRTPKSPPRSPSAWMQRLRESPTRATQPGGNATSSGGCRGSSTSGGMRSPTQLSPGSAVERYPTNELSDAPVGMPSNDDEASSAHNIHDGLDNTCGGANSGSRFAGGAQRRSISDTASTGNASSSAEQQRNRCKGSGKSMESATLDLASFAASVASGAAHLTQLSDSPPDLLLRPSPTTSAVSSSASPSNDPQRHVLGGNAPLQMISGTVTVLSSAGPSFVAADFLSPDEYVGITSSFDVRQQNPFPMQRNQTSGAATDCLGQIVPPLPPPLPPPPPPPAPQENQSSTDDVETDDQTSAAGGCGDWSLRVDLSPIIDVSPSIERLEQEKMLADQRQLRPSSTKHIKTFESSSSSVETTSSAFGVSGGAAGLTAEMMESKVVSTTSSTSATETSPTTFGLMKRCSSFSDIPTLTSQDDPLQPTPSAVGSATAAVDFDADVFRFDCSSGIEIITNTIVNGKQMTSQDRQTESPPKKNGPDNDDDELVGGLQKFDDWFKAAFQELISQDKPESKTDNHQEKTTTALASFVAFSTSSTTFADAEKSALSVVTSGTSAATSSQSTSMAMVDTSKKNGVFSAGFRHQDDYHEDDDEDELIHHGQFVSMESDEIDEDHEIDLDEDIPPKHVFVATSKFRKQRTLEKQDAVDDNSSSLPSTHQTALNEEHVVSSQLKSIQSASSFDEFLMGNRSSSSRRKLPSLPEGVDPFSQTGDGSNNNTCFEAARLRRIGSFNSGSKSASADDALYGRKSATATQQQQMNNSTGAAVSSEGPTNPGEKHEVVIESSRRNQGMFVRSKSADERTKVSTRPVYSTRPVGTELYDFEDDEEMNEYFRKRSQSLQPEVREIDASKQVTHETKIDSSLTRRPNKPPPPPPTPPRPQPPTVPPKPEAMKLPVSATTNKQRSTLPDSGTIAPSSVEPDGDIEGSEDGEKSPDYSDTPTIIRRPCSTTAVQQKSKPVALSGLSETLETTINLAEKTLEVYSSGSVFEDVKMKRSSGAGEETSIFNTRKSTTNAWDESADVVASFTKPEIPPKPPRVILKKAIPPPPRPPESKVITVCRGLEVPDTVHALKLRIKDEIKIVTATTRLRLDEEVQVRIMEAEFAERVREQEKKRNQLLQAAAAASCKPTFPGVGYGDSRRRVEPLPMDDAFELDERTATEYHMSRYWNGIEEGGLNHHYRVFAGDDSAAGVRTSHFHAATDALSYRQRGGGSESDSAMYDCRFSPIEEDLGTVDSVGGAFDCEGNNISEMYSMTKDQSSMFSPKTIYLGTSALPVRGTDRRSPAFNKEADPWFDSPSLREHNCLSRSTDLIEPTAGNRMGNSNESPSMARVACRRSVSSELNSARITIAAVAAELNADDAEDFYHQLNSTSGSRLPVDMGYGYRTNTADIERRNKEEKLLHLQMEIERRRRHLQELSQNEMVRIASPASQQRQQQHHHHRRDVASSSGLAADWQQKNFGHSGVGMERYKYQTLPARTSMQSALPPLQVQQQDEGQDVIVGKSGLIKPIDYQIDVEKYYLQSSASPKSSNSGSGRYNNQLQKHQPTEFNHRGPPEPSVGDASSSLAIYSSYEYLAHRAEFSPPIQQQQNHTANRSQQHQRNQSAASNESHGASPRHRSETANSRSLSFPAGGTLDRFRRDDSSERVVAAAAAAAAAAEHGNQAILNASGSGSGGGTAGPNASERFTYSTSEDSLAYYSGSAGGGLSTMNHAGSRDSGVSSSLTGGEMYSTNPSIIPSSSGTYGRSASTSGAVERSASSVSPQKNAVFDDMCVTERPRVVGKSRQSGYEAPTPAMPILDDVTSRSRNLLRDIGSRPLSDDVEKYFHAEEPLNLMFCGDESEYSLAAAADSGDENVMEGGLTIRQQQQQQLQRFGVGGKLPIQRLLRSYTFPTKCILLTADPKATRGNGIGVKVIGGQPLPWAENQVGAYVASILPGSVADQIHGELHEGDQVLEWNGEPLTGKSYEEVKEITSYCNGGEVEIVVRPIAFIMNTADNRSFYDNMDLDSTSYQESVTTTKSQPEVGVNSGQAPPSYSDVLVGRAATQSPGRLGALQPKLSGSGSLTRGVTDKENYRKEPTVQQQQQQTRSAENSLRRKKESVEYTGEIQLQLSYDDYDGTLNVHIIKARNLLPKYKTGNADPFVKVYLLPYKSSEHKGRTKTVPRTLEPEWHRTLVFLNIPKDQLSEKGIEFTVWDHDRFMSNQCLGEVVLELSDSNCLDNQPHWYPLFDEDQSTRFGRRPRVQTLSPSDSSESSTTTRHSSADSLSEHVSGLDKPAAVTRSQRKRGVAATAASAAVSTSATGRFRGDPDGSPVPQQQTRAAAANRTAGSGGSTPRRRPYGHGSPSSSSPVVVAAPPSSDGGRVRRDLDVDLIPTEDSFEMDNEECVDELFLKHHHDRQQQQQQQLQQPVVAKHHLISSIAVHDGEQRGTATNRLSSAVFDPQSSTSFLGMLNSIFCCLRPLCGSSRQITFPSLGKSLALLSLM